MISNLYLQENVVELRNVIVHVQHYNQLKFHVQQ